MARHLQDQDIRWGINIVHLQEMQNGPELAYFDDQFEEAIVSTTIEVLKPQKRNDLNSLHEKQNDIS